MFRLGRVCPPKGPGIVLVLPLIDQWQRVDLRTRAFNIPPCQVHLNTHTHRCFCTFLSQGPEKPFGGDIFKQKGGTDLFYVVIVL